MSLFANLIVDPVFRQARRFSGTAPHEQLEQQRAEGRWRPLSHAGLTPPLDPPAEPAAMSSNPARALHSQRHRLDLDSPLSATLVTATPVTATPPPQSPANASPSSTTQHAAAAMSELLPADDGMRHLRARIHDIRSLAIADDDKAHLMHSLMTERYNLLRPTSPSSFVSHDRPFTPTSGHSVFSDAPASSPASHATEFDPENPYNLRPGDTEPTFRPQSSNLGADHGEDEEHDPEDEVPALGCQHYKRNVKVQCYECRRWYTCRNCHDSVEDHNLNRRKTENMLCMLCQTPQPAGEYCMQCGAQAACYYCDVCKLWDNNSQKKIYHCADCGICRRGEGLGKDYIHCKKCNVCISIAHGLTHKCLQRATECDCPICGDYLFTSSTAVVSMPCGHYMHKGCYSLYMETAYKCPVCKKSAVNMELQWQKLTQAIESQPMPEQFADTRAVIQCNDCAAKSSVKYHWLGNKCSTCDSYNTNELRILNGPESEQAANALLDADADSGARSPASVSSPASQPLRSPRYYFQPDQPAETWLPDQFPSLPFQMPHFPAMPQMPQLPAMPQFPPFPQMPQILDPYDILERVRKSFDHYLNSPGDMRTEDVPIIDLGDDPRERQATDGTTVLEPSLPQYVFERFSRSLPSLRNYLNPSIDNIPSLDLTDSPDPDALQFWGEDGGRFDRFLSGEEDDIEDEESSSDDTVDEYEEDDEDDEDDDGHSEEKRNIIELPGHR